MNNIANEVVIGMRLASDPKVIETARKFMEDNGFKNTQIGKRVACNYISDFLSDDPSFSTAVQMAIILL